MNDPHVESLYYRLVPGPGVTFESAGPLEYDTPAFKVSLANGQAVFAMKEHCDSEVQALELVQPFVEKWEIASGLNVGPSAFKLEFERAQIIDRSPTPGVLEAVGVMTGRSVLHAPALAVHSRYPDPPDDFEATEIVKAMYYQFKGFKEGMLAIGHAAYFCKTVIEANRGTAYYGISNTILRRIGTLSSEKGGLEARKAIGMGKDLSNQERRWLEEAVKLIIRRAAERAAKPFNDLPQLTMADLPPLE